MYAGSGAGQSDQSHYQRFSAALDELTKIRDEVVRVKDWHKRHAKRPMVFFRVVGVSIIVLSVSVPFIGALEDESIWKSFVLPVITLAIAGLTGVNAFFQWQTQWQEYRQTQYALEHLLWKWELEIVRAKSYPEEERAIQIAVEATDRLLDLAREATATGTNKFFETTRVPDTRLQ